MMRCLAKLDSWPFRTYYFILISGLRIPTTKDVIPRNAIGLSFGIFLAPLLKRNQFTVFRREN